MTGQDSTRQDRAEQDRAEQDRAEQDRAEQCEVKGTRDEGRGSVRMRVLVLLLLRGTTNWSGEFNLVSDGRGGEGEGRGGQGRRG